MDAEIVRPEPYSSSLFSPVIDNPGQACQTYWLLSISVSLSKATQDGGESTIIVIAAINFVLDTRAAFERIGALVFEISS
jgi:hypothetical protein